MTVFGLFDPQKHRENIIDLRRIAFGTDSDTRKLVGSMSTNDYKKLGFTVSPHKAMNT